MRDKYRKVILYAKGTGGGPPLEEDMQLSDLQLQIGELMQMKKSIQGVAGTVAGFDQLIVSIIFIIALHSC